MFHYFLRATLSIVVLPWCLCCWLFASQLKQKRTSGSKEPNFIPPQDCWEDPTEGHINNMINSSAWENVCSLPINTHLEIQKCFKGMHEIKHSIMFSTKTSVGLNWEWHTMLYSKALIITHITIKWLNKADRGIICSMLTAYVLSLFPLKHPQNIVSQFLTEPIQCVVSIDGMVAGGPATSEPEPN